MKTHGYFTPSQLELRFRCPGSVALDKELPEEPEDEGSPDALLGRQKHEIARKLRAGEIQLEPATPDDVVFCKQKTDEILAGLPPDATVVAEYQIDLRYLGIDPGTEGCRVDFLAVVPGRFAVVADDKYGAMRVDNPKYNWQMKGYCAGVARAFGVPEVQCIILQPNIDEESRFRSCVFTAAELTEAEDGIKEIIVAALKPGAPLVRGEHCGDCFCKCRPTCPLYRDAFLAIPQSTPVEKFMSALSPEKRRELYENLLAANKFTEKAIEAVKAVVVAGKMNIEGYEVADGKKTRIWKSNGFAMSELETLAATKGLEKDAVVQPITPAAAEKLFGKKVLEPLIEYKVGNPVLKKS